MNTLTRMKRLVRPLLGLNNWETVPDFEETIFCTLIERGDCVYDIGANVGTSANTFSAAAGESGLVIAFEPVPQTFVKLCRQVAGPGRRAPVVPFPIGVSDFNGTRNLCFCKNNSGLSSLGGIADGEWIECRFAMLDSVRETFALPEPDFMKVDVEGAELLVFHGAAQTLATGPLIFVEAFRPWQRTLGIEMWDVLSLLIGCGYEFLFQCPEGLIEHRPTADAPCPAEYERGYNVIAHLPKHSQRIAKLNHLHQGNTVPRMKPPPLLNT
jgi:FkbM family methyltransferase